MENDKVIILGASGLVGRYLFEEFKSERIPVIGTYNKNEKEGLVYFDILNSSIDDLELEGVKYV
ncbi:MAG: NAD-dependent epimerase/dehydratase family protein, partial [Nanoarchaeota archaeon]|nr:NAD-dependent epimerase/dehydratase family protein [Nanoarchaeota archaeon]